MSKPQFTNEQIQNWREYEMVRAGGRYNMFDPRTREMTGLGREDYMFVLKNYCELKEAACEAHLKERTK